jgi:hypothetical protein
MPFPSVLQSFLLAEQTDSTYTEMNSGNLETYLSYWQSSRFSVVVRDASFELATPAV